MNDVLELDAEIYSEKAILCAIRDYSNIARVSLTTENGKHLCRFVKTKYELALTIKEFENYVIDLSNQQRLFN